MPDLLSAIIVASTVLTSAEVLAIATIVGITIGGLMVVIQEAREWVSGP